MVEDVAAVGGVSGIESGPQVYELDRLSDQAQTETVNSTNFSNLVDSALNKALEGPHGHDAQGDFRQQITGSESGPVGTEKNEFVSDVSRPGAESKAQVEGETQVLDAVADRANQLYTEMTIYHVAWGVAMRTQKDISQLLRGS